MSTSGNFPNPGSPIAGSDGRLSPEWLGFFLALFNRTGGSGSPTDLSALQKQLTAHEGEITSLFSLENSSATGALLGALTAKISYLERQASSNVQPMQRPACGLPAPVSALISQKTDLPVPVYPAAAGKPDLPPPVSMPVPWPAAPGSSGQVLTSTGPVSSPSFQSIPSQVGRLINVQVLTSTQTYTKTPGTNSQIVELQAPGGSGGGTAATGTGQSAAAAGGGSGSYARVYIPVAVSGVTVTLPAGPAGAAAGANNGTAGSAASFGSYVTCPGGTAGGAGSATSSASITGASTRSAAPTVSGGAVALALVPGSSGAIGLVANPGVASIGGHGGPSPMFPAAFQDKGGSGSGINGSAPGEGGGGANQAAASGAANAGGSAANAYAIVWEYA